MSSSPSTSAVDRVFGTFELLEHILLDVAHMAPKSPTAGSKTPFAEGAICLRTVLLSQRVCTKFRDIITNSPPLQQALHFGPAPKKPVPGSSIMPTNHLLEHTFIIGDMFLYGWEYDMHSRRLGDSKAMRPWRHNAKYRDSKKNEVEVHGEESWRRMRLFTYYENPSCADH